MSTLTSEHMKHATFCINDETPVEGFLYKGHHQLSEIQGNVHITNKTDNRLIVRAEGSNRKKLVTNMNVSSKQSDSILIKRS